MNMKQEINVMSNITSQEREPLEINFKLNWKQSEGELLIIH